MSIALRGTAGRGRGRAPISEINITPMVDVMLVLLIVFMVAAPLMTMGVPVDLPQTRAQDMRPRAKPVTITVAPDGNISIAGEMLTLDTVVAAVAELFAVGADERLYVRGDTDAAYGAVMAVMGELAAAGHVRIGLITTSVGAP